MRRLFTLVAAFLRRAAIIDFSYRGSFVFTTASLVFSLWTLFFLARTFGPSASPHLAVSGGDYFRFALIGLAFALPLRMGASGVSQRVRELQFSGALESLIAAPVSPFAAILLHVLYPLLNSLLRSLLVVLLGVLVFGAELPNASWGAGLVTLLAGMSAYLGFGILSASFVIVFKRGDPVAWALDAATFLLSGIIYPVQVLPPLLQDASQLVPATHALRALRRAFLQGATLAELSQEIGILLGFAVVVLPFSALVLRLALRRAARDGTLGQS